MANDQSYSDPAWRELTLYNLGIVLHTFKNYADSDAIYQRLVDDALSSQQEGEEELSADIRKSKEVS